jgi:regulator of replication initiation timing
MDIEELLKEIIMLKEENSKLKSQLENYNNSRKSYYEKNKEHVKAQAKELGYKYEIWVYDGKGIKVKKYQ